MTIIESDGFRFNVSDNFIGGKYDKWNFYSNEINKIDGAKAVDLVVAAIDYSVSYLIEIKDFRVNPVTHERRIRTKPSELHQEIAAKVLHSLGGLLAARLRATDADEQSIAKATCRASSLRVVLHLEQSSGGRLFPQIYNPANIQSKLRKTLKAVDPHALVVSINLPGNLPWTVS